MGWHMGATAGLIGSAILTWKEYKKGGFNRVVRSWTGWDMDDEIWIAANIRAALPLTMGAGATYAAIKTGFNDWTPTGWNV